ncbi:hypothetical protein D0Y65_029839, partial [Glycine soja]
VYSCFFCTPIIYDFKNEAIQVAFVVVVETPKEGKVKVDINGKHKVLFFYTFGIYISLLYFLYVYFSYDSKHRVLLKFG